MRSSWFLFVAGGALAIAGCMGETPADDLAVPPVDAAMAMPDLSPTCLPGEPTLAGEFPDGSTLDPACPVRLPPQTDSFDDLLALAGTDRCHLGYSAHDWLGWGTSRHKDPYRLPFFDGAHDYAVNGPAFARGLVSHLDEAAASATPVARALLLAGDRIGAPPATCMPPLPDLDATRPLASAVATLIRDAGGTADDTALDTDAADVPLDLQRALARVILGLDRANADWKSLTSGLSSDALAALYETGDLAAGQTGLDPSDPMTRDVLSNQWNLPALVGGAARLAFAVETSGLTAYAGTKGFAFDQRTPLGRIVVHDGKDDVYEEVAMKDAILLVVDTGGNDTYRAAVGATGGDQCPGNLGVAIDLAGSDHYGYAEHPRPLDGTRLPSDVDGRSQPNQYYGPISRSDQPRQGGARLGYGMLFDYGDDDDHYRSLRMSQGLGIAGVGVLFDAGGSDTYEGELLVQGAATFGVGLLLDEKGDDTYRTYTESQGFGYVRGAGILYDGAGKDQYLADVGDPQYGGDPMYYTPQLPNKGNSSFTQGAGYGRRAPGDTGPGDRAFMSGGLGVLRDKSGDDVYLTSVFGQATSYWFGTGILADGGGNDHYDGLWYVQGAGAHAGLSIFLDDSGDDQYQHTVAPAATAIGLGHDYSVAWHIDGGGNDVYRAPGLSLGSGYTNGIGVLINLGGDDTYQAAGDLSLGSATIGDAVGDNLRRSVPTTGLFLDVGGADHYSGGPLTTATDDTTWIYDRDPPDAGYTNHSAGTDRAMGSVNLP